MLSCGPLSIEVRAIKISQAWEVIAFPLASTGGQSRRYLFL